MKFEGSTAGRLALTPENDEERELLQATKDMGREALLYWGDAETKGEDGHYKGWVAFIINTHRVPSESPASSAPPTVEAEAASGENGVS